MSDLQDTPTQPGPRTTRDLLKLLQESKQVSKEDADQARHRMKRSNISAQQALSDLVDEVKGVHESESEAVRQVGLLKTTSEPDKKPEPKKPE